MTNWFTRVAAAVEREYDRRIRRASLIDVYGASHEHADDEDDGVAIANLPRGTTLPAWSEPAVTVAEPADVPEAGLPELAATPAAVDAAPDVPLAPAAADDAAPTIASVAPETTAAQADDDDEAEISNVPPGAAPKH